MIKYIKYPIKNGDTIYSIAQKLLGDYNRGLELASINDLDYPFIVETSNNVYPQNTKKPGDYLLVPLEEDGVNDFLKVQENLDSIQLGTDIFLSTESTNLSNYAPGEFKTASNNDLSYVSGVQTLTQDLIHRLVTEKGTLPFHPEYGSDLLKIIGSKGTVESKQKAVVEVTSAIRSDIRVSDVSNVEVNVLSTGIQISAIIEVSGKRFRLSEVI